MNGAEKIMNADHRKLATWMENHGFHKLIGLKIDRLEPKLCQISLEIGEHHLNPFHIVHGSVLFTLADVSFGVACNGEGQTAVTLSSSIQFIAPAGLGDRLTALARETSSGGRTAHYQVEIKRGDGTLVAFATGIMYRRPVPVSEFMTDGEIA